MLARMVCARCNLIHINFLLLVVLRTLCSYCSVVALSSRSTAQKVLDEFSEIFSQLEGLEALVRLFCGSCI